MAFNSVLQSVALAIEVSAGQDKQGNEIYRKRNYNGIKGTATPEQLGAVAEAIKSVISLESRDTYKNSVEKINGNE